MARALSAAAFILGSQAAAAQGPSVVPVETLTVTRRVLVAGDLTPAEARRRALEQALGEAVGRALGVRVQSAQIGVVDDHDARVRDSFVSVVQLEAAGRATDYRVIDERFVSEHHPSLGEQLYVEITALVSVAHELGRADPGFTVNVALNDALFFDTGGSIDRNDEIVATITSTRDAWLTVFGVAGDSVHLLLPNALMTDRRAYAGRPVELPSHDWRSRGVRFRASLPPGESARRELLMVVATRTPVTFTAAARRSGDTGATASLMDIQRWLVSIPLEDRAVGFAVYEVRRR